MASAAPQVSRHFSLLHRRVQERVYDMGWAELCGAQEEAIAPILAGCDVLISAPTAGGKTEAAILPIASQLLAPENRGAVAVCISPLKALINNQYDRLKVFCEPLGIAVHAWHGDVAANRKTRLLTGATGIVIITPESLEAIFVRRGAAIPVIFGVHSFWGSARGKQVQSLMDRLEQSLLRRIPRIGLSATVGDMSLATEFLRPQNPKKVQLLRSQPSDRDTHISVYGYDISERETRVVDNLWKLRGSNNLVFVNSRGAAELYVDLLSRRATELGVRNEFVPHHAGLSKRSREDLEAALKRQSQPITAICTATLELGIDLGEIKQVSQVGPPPSAASAMQRLGRSGRRANPAILKVHIAEAKDTLCEDLVQTIAMIDLGLAGWSEPPQLAGLHLSTLLQQILSVIAQTGGVTASMAWDALVRRGPFQSVSDDVFRAVLRNMAAADLISQGPDGVLILGAAGQTLTRFFGFYAAFDTRLEYRLVYGRTTLGKLVVAPFAQPFTGEVLLFAGRSWRIVDVNYQRRRVDVVPANAGGVWPAPGGGGDVRDEVRQQMFGIYVNSAECHYLDPVASELLAVVRSRFTERSLATRRFYAGPSGGDLFTWRGDRVNETLALWLRHLGLRACHYRMSVSVRAPETTLRKALRQIAESDVDEIELARLGTMAPEKFGRFLGNDLILLEFAVRRLDIDGARQAARACLAEAAPPHEEQIVS